MIKAIIKTVVLAAMLLGLAAASYKWIAAPVLEWLVLRSIYSEQAIRQHDPGVVKFIRPHSAVFSNGERHDYGVALELFAGALWIAGCVIGAGLLSVPLHRVLPAAHAFLFPTEALKRGWRRVGRRKSVV